jgi:hypothetical protein
MIKDVAFPTLVKTQHGWQYQCLHDYNERRLRATVYRDSYDFQSYAYVEVWAGDHWEKVVTRRGEQIDFLPSHYERSEERWRSAAESLVDALLAEAYFVLGGK